MCDVHDFPETQETEQKDHLGPGFRARKGSWQDLVNSKTTATPTTNELYFTFIVRLSLRISL